MGYRRCNLQLIFIIIIDCNLIYYNVIRVSISYKKYMHVLFHF